MACKDGRNHKWSGGRQEDPCFKCGKTRYGLQKSLVGRVENFEPPNDILAGNDPYIKGFETGGWADVKNPYPLGEIPAENEKHELFEMGRNDAAEEARQRQEKASRLKA